MIRYKPRWLATSVRNKLLAMALLPLLVVFPLLVLAIAAWSNITYDRLLITKVRSDLAVARGYFDQVLIEVGSGTRGVAGSQRLLSAMQPSGTVVPQGQTDAALRERLSEARRGLGLDFLLLYGTDGQPLGSAEDNGPHAALPLELQRLVPEATLGPGSRSARLMRLDTMAIARMAPQLMPRLHIPLVPTRNAAPDVRTTEDRAMVVISLQPVRDTAGRTTALLAGGLLLNQNLDFIDHINRIVYPEGALPFGSQGTATLFLDDVRITTNVRLFQDQRAIGTRVSRAVRDTVLGETPASLATISIVTGPWPLLCASLETPLTLALFFMAPRILNPRLFWVAVYAQETASKRQKAAEKHQKNQPWQRFHKTHAQSSRCKRQRGATPGVQPSRCERAQRTMSAAPMAPGCRATSRPFTNSASVGMLRMLKRAARLCASSVFTLARRMPGSSCCAACSNAGAIARQGPHQGAQKSTSTGTCERAMCFSNAASSSATGWPVNRGWWHLPQSGAAERSALAMRLVVWQWGQTMCRDAVDMRRAPVGRDA